MPITCQWRLRKTLICERNTALPNKCLHTNHIRGAATESILWLSYPHIKPQTTNFESWWHAIILQSGVISLKCPDRYHITHDLSDKCNSPQNTSAFWELLGAITAINPPREPEQATYFASLAPIGLSLRGFGFDPNNLTSGVIGGMNAGLAAALGCVISNAQTRQKASITSTRWEPLLEMADHGTD